VIDRWGWRDGIGVLDAHIGEENQVSEAMKRPAAAQQAAAKVLRGTREGRAARRGKDPSAGTGFPGQQAVHASVGHATFEVIDAAAVEEAIWVSGP